MLHRRTGLVCIAAEIDTETNSTVYVNLGILPGPPVNAVIQDSVGR